MGEGEFTGFCCKKRRNAGGGFLELIFFGAGKALIEKIH